MATYIEKWFSELPPITKGLFFIYLTSAFVGEFIESNYFLFNWNYFSTYLTTFLFFDQLLSVYFVYQLLLFVSYSKGLEYEYSYSNRRKDYFFCLLFGGIIILLLSALRPLKGDFLSRSLVFYIIYLYNNYKNPDGTTAFHPALFIDNKYMTVFLIFVSASFQMFKWSEYFIGIVAAYLNVTLEQVGTVRTIVGYF